MKKLIALVLCLVCLCPAVMAEDEAPAYDLAALLQLPAVEAVPAIAAAKETEYCKYLSFEDGGDIFMINCEIGKLQIFYGLHYACQVIEDVFQHPDVPGVFVSFFEKESGMRPVHIRLTRETFESLDWAKVKDLIYDDMEGFMAYMDGWSAMKDYKNALKY